MDASSPRRLPVTDGVLRTVSSIERELPMNRFVASALLVLLVVPAAVLAVDGNKAEYVGGTIAGLKEKSEGRIDTTNDTALVFTANRQSELRIPYAGISELEYGQKAGRRVGVAIMISPLALFSKKRNHYLTISYKDDAGKDQAAVFELGKDIVRTTLKSVETRSGKDIQYQDDEARKSIGGGKGK
jgi:hypothetical protein